MATSLCP